MSETSSRADLLYREAETSKRLMSGAQAIDIFAASLSLILDSERAKHGGRGQPAPSGDS
jgi:hypothetical protein